MSSMTVQDVPLTALRPAPWNPRTISDERFQNLCRSIEAHPDFLWHRPVLAQADGTIYAGNMRFRAAEHLGMAAVPAVVEDVPDQLARERALRDNAQWGAWAEDDLALLLKDLEQQGSELGLLGFDDRELQQFLDRLAREGTGGDPDAVPETPAEPVSRLGDRWQLGEHRVLCGDCTDPEAVQRLMGGEQAVCLWTDPPYGINYVGGTEQHLTIQNDTAEGLEALLTGAFAAIDAVLAPGAAFYVCHPAGPLSVTFGRCVLAQGWRLRQTLVWLKDAFVLGHSDYHYKHEPILYGVKVATDRRGRGAAGWYGGNDASSVFEVPRPRVNADHPTSKPVALIETMLKNSTKTDEIVLDAFLGSGSTLVAAERLGRRCYGLELDPKYVDVIVQRWEAYTGRKAVRS